MQHTGHESPGAVDGIDHPGQAITRLESVLLAKDAMLGVSSFDGLANRPLAGLIRQGHRIKAAVFELVGHLHARAEMRQDHLASCAHGRSRELHEGIALLVGYCHCRGIAKFHGHRISLGAESLSPQPWPS